jgi:hypothetical protein
MTVLSKDQVTVQRARSILKQWRELMGGGPGKGVWTEIDRLFRQQDVRPWTAAQFFVHHAAGVASRTPLGGGETLTEIENQSAVLGVNYSYFPILPHRRFLTFICASGRPLQP